MPGFGEQLRNALDKLRLASHVDQSLIKEVVKELQRSLISADVEVKTVLELSKKIETESLKEPPSGISRKEFIVKTTHDLLAELLGGTAHSPPEKPKKILLIGLFGSGKSTTCGKIAHYYQKRGLKVGLVAADTFRPAAVQQLQQLGEKVHCTVYALPGEKSAKKVVEYALKNAKEDLLIVDSAGRSALDPELVKEVKEIHGAFRPEQTWLVLGADMGQLAGKQASAFHETVGVNGVILTRMDGSAKGGGALAACAITKSPVYFIGVGEKMQDLEAFDGTRYLSRIMGYGDLQGLLEKVKEATEEEAFDPEAMLKQEFTLQTFYDQLKMSKKMGPLNKVAEMMGMSMKMPKEAMELGEKKLDSFKHAMESMTQEERRNPEVLTRSRIERIARGSGRKEEEVRELLRQYKQMKSMWGQFKKLNESDVKEMQSGKMQKLMQKFQGKKKKKLKLK